MWETRLKNVPHARQYNNIVVESYHTNMKCILSDVTMKFQGQYMNWLIYLPPETYLHIVSILYNASCSWLVECKEHCC